MIKRMLIMLVLFGVVLGGLFGFKVFVNGKIKEAMAGMANVPQTVSATKAQSSDWQPTIDAVGSLRAVRGADLSLEVPGVVEEILFQSGDEVQEGQILLRLRNQDEVAKLQSLEATAQLAQITYDRDVKQLKAQAISQAIVDNDQANLRNARAQVAQQQAIVDKKVLRAPFAGKLGLRQVDLGQFLSAGSVIATLQSLDPIFVDFLLPQQAVARLAVGSKVETRVDAFPDRVFAGTITAINPKIETASRNVQVRATLPNADQKLLPGMFATVQLQTGAAERLVTLPQTAVSYNPYGSLVYVVDETGQGPDKGPDKGPDGKPHLVARQVFVTTGATRGDQVAILKGVAEGDTIVTSGQIKLRNGVPIVIDNRVVPANDPAPKIVDH